MRVLITGSNGFIGKNLKLNLTQHRIKIETFEKGENINNLKKKIEISDTIIHLAGTNVSKNKLEFNKNNFSFSKKICDILKKSNKKKNFFFASTEQCKQKKKTSYIRSKLKAEKEILKLKNNKNVQICIARLPNIFGKFCKPNYNSFVATCCNNLINNKQIKIYNTKRIYNLMHIDDLNDQIMNTFIKRRIINKRPFMNLKKIYKCKAENLYKKINFLIKIIKISF